MSLISLKNIYKIYNVGGEEVRALDGVDLTIKENEYLAIMGHPHPGCMNSKVKKFMKWMTTS